MDEPIAGTYSMNGQLDEDDPSSIERYLQGLQSEVNKMTSAKYKEQEERKKFIDTLNTVLEILSKDEESIAKDPESERPNHCPILHQKLNFTTAEKRDLISRGVPINTRRYELEEDCRILRSLHDFMKSYSISDAYDLLYSDSYSIFRKDCNLYQHLAKGLDCRTLQSVLDRARRLVKSPEKTFSSLINSNRGSRIWTLLQDSETSKSLLKNCSSSRSSLQKSVPSGKSCGAPQSPVSRCKKSKKLKTHHVQEAVQNHLESKTHHTNQGLENHHESDTHHSNQAVENHYESDTCHTNQALENHHESDTCHTNQALENHQVSKTHQLSQALENHQVSKTHQVSQALENHQVSKTHQLSQALENHQVSKTHQLNQALENHQESKSYQLNKALENHQESKSYKLNQALENQESETQQINQSLENHQESETRHTSQVLGNHLESDVHHISKELENLQESETHHNNHVSESSESEMLTSSSSNHVISTSSSLGHIADAPTSEKVHGNLQLVAKKLVKNKKSFKLRKSTTPKTSKNLVLRKSRTKLKSSWSSKDDQYLINALKMHVGKETMLIPVFNHPWRDISKKVPNKSFSQCKKHWATSLYWSWKSKVASKWPRVNYALLIYAMHKYLVYEENQIDWDKLFDIFGCVSSTYGKLMLYWDRLKDLVPNYIEKNHEEIVLYLYHECLPLLLRKCNLHTSDFRCRAESFLHSKNYESFLST